MAAGRDQALAVLEQASWRRERRSRARRTLRDGTFPGWGDALIAGVAENRGGLAIVTGNADRFPASETVTYA